MSKGDSSLLGFDTQQLVRWGFILLLAVTGFGSIIDGGAISGTYNQNNFMVYIPVLLLMYFILVLIMYSTGEPNKFEIVFIPTLIIIMIVVSMSYADLIPPVESGGENTAQPTSPFENTQVDRTTNPTNPTENSVTIQTGVNDNPGNDPFLNFLKNIAPAISIIALLAILGFLLYWLVNRKEFDPDIQIHRVKEYSKSVFETNNTIIEYYIDASIQIEKLKGKAPEWFSPTKFSTHVIESPGPPLSSYFDKITEKYENARFGQKEMSMEEVDEVKELHHQIINQVNMILRKLGQEEEEQI